MMLTAVTTAALITTSDSVATALTYGPGAERVAHPRGELALLQPNQIAIYSLRARTLRAYLFRTLEKAEPMAARVPGLSQPVRLLIHLRSERRLRTLGNLFAELRRLGQSPALLPDLFFLRLGGVVAGRAPDPSVVGALLKEMADESGARAWR